MKLSSLILTIIIGMTNQELVDHYANYLGSPYAKQDFMENPEMQTAQILRTILQDLSPRHAL